MMWIKPKEVGLGKSLWVTESANFYFVLQQRKGYGTKGLSSLFVGTMDSVFDTKPLPFRILLHPASSEKNPLWIASAFTKSEIMEDWGWLEKHVVATLSAFDDENERRNFVACKIESLVAQKSFDSNQDPDSMQYKLSSMKFSKLFNMPKEEKLVNYYSCCFWKNKLPCQGWLYLSVNHIGFHSQLFGKQVKLVIRWVDVTQIEKNDSFVFPDSITIVTLTKKFHFSMYLKLEETFSLMQQLANLAMKKLISEESFETDTELVNKLSKNVPKKTSYLKRDLDAGAHSEAYSIESPAMSVLKPPPLKVVPEGVEDFDKSCLKDPFSESRYAADIFSYYLEREKLFPVKKYLHLQKGMTRGMRATLVDWMVEVQESFELNHETLYLAVKLVDRYLSKNRVPKSHLQLIGATAICIAAKFDEKQPPLVDDFLYICDDSYTREQLIETEIKMLETVDFDLGIPLSYRFLQRFARCARLSMEKLTLARYILETALMDYELMDVLDSKLAAASLLLALKMKNQEWTPTYTFYTGYKAEELKEIVYSLNKNIATPIHNLQTIRTKYSHQVFFEVSKVPPLSLPK